MSEVKKMIAYFSMEIGIRSSIPTYSGGLGILAGDTLKSMADSNMNIVAVTLLNKKGYFYQKIDDDGNQQEEPVNWIVEDFLEPLPNKTVVKIGGRDVFIKVWRLKIRGNSGHDNPIYYLDTDVPENTDYDRELTSYLYGGDRSYRLSQEIILGVGGIRILDTLGYENIKKFHMNEGHAALLTVELLRKTKDRLCLDDSSALEAVRKKCIFTTHTPVAAGHDRFDKDLFFSLLDDYVPDFVLDKASQDDKINMTLIGLMMSGFVNGVAKRHKEITKNMFPEHEINSITNGVHPKTWIANPIKKILDKLVVGWEQDSYSLRRALSIKSDELMSAHKTSKIVLMDYINEKMNAGFDFRRFTIGYARRFTPYKRPDLILHDLERLKKIANKVGDIQIVFSGKAHRQDLQGKEILKRVIGIAKEVNAIPYSKLKIVFLEHYDMRIAKMLVSGCDVWLNNPQRPYEASGTSGMKAALNGVPQISTLDGWWIEGCIEGVTGWSIGPHPEDENFNNDPTPDDEAEDLYYKLENQIIPLFYSSADEWVKIMKHCIAINGGYFNTNRMVQQYIASAYNE